MPSVHQLVAQNEAMNYAAPMLPGMMEPNSYMASMGQVGSGTQQPTRVQGVEAHGCAAGVCAASGAGTSALWN